MKIKYRSLKKSDFEQIKDFLPSMWFAHSTNSDLVSEKRLKQQSVIKYLQKVLDAKNQQGYVATHEKKVVGFIKCEKRKCPDFYHHKHEVYIDDLIVLDNYKRKGIATNLIKKCKSYAKNQNICLISTKIWNFNKNSKSLFKNLGFKSDFSFYSYQVKK